MNAKVIQGSFIGGQPKLAAPVQPRIAAPPQVHAKSAAGPPVLAFVGRYGPPASAFAAKPPGPPVPAFAGRAGTMQRHGSGGAFAMETGRLGLASGGGRPLPEAVRGKMEAALGADFANVRVHVGPQAERIGAIAFTIGSDIYFAPGRYQPDTVRGQQLLGHELAHVVQQRAGRVNNPFGSDLAIVQDHALEAEAERIGMRAAAAPMPIQAKQVGMAPVVAPGPATVSRLHTRATNGAILPVRSPAHGPAQRKPGPILPAKSSISGKRVARAAPSRRGTPSRVLQRLSIEPPIKWKNCTAVTISSSGASGVFFFHEGKKFDRKTTIVAKVEDSPPGHHAVAKILHEYVNVGIAPESRALTPEEVTKARRVIEQKCDWAAAAEIKNRRVPTSNETAATLRAKKLAQWDGGPYWIVMKMAQGESHADLARELEARDLIKLLDNEALWRAIGAMTVVDIFLENQDRIYSKNSGNWMITPGGGLEPIDNINQFQSGENRRSPRSFQQWWDRLDLSNLFETAREVVENVWDCTFADWKKARKGDFPYGIGSILQYKEMNDWTGTVYRAMKHTRQRLVMTLNLEEVESLFLIKAMRRQDSDLVDRLLGQATHTPFTDILQQMGILASTPKTGLPNPEPLSLPAVFI